MKNIIRTPETHPLTWRLRDDKQPVWLDEYRSSVKRPSNVVCPGLMFSFFSSAA